VAFDFVPELYRKFMVCSIIIGRLVYLMKLIFDTILISYQALLCCTAAAASRLLMYWHCDLVPCDRSSQHPKLQYTTGYTTLNPNQSLDQKDNRCHLQLQHFPRPQQFLHRWIHFMDRTRDPSLVMAVYGGCDESTLIGEALPTKRSARRGADKG
jgi:hypothetical protein